MTPFDVQFLHLCGRFVFLPSYFYLHVITVRKLLSNSSSVAVCLEYMISNGYYLLLCASDI